MEVPNSKCKDMLPFQRPREKFLTLGPSPPGNGGVISYFIANRCKGQSPPYHWPVILCNPFDDGVYGPQSNDR